MLLFLHPAGIYEEEQKEGRVAVWHPFYRLLGRTNQHTCDCFANLPPSMILLIKPILQSPSWFCISS